MEVIVQSENANGITSGDGLLPLLPGMTVGDWAGIAPWSIVGVAIAGATLLLVGAKILRPAMVLAATMLGAILGVAVGDATGAGSLPTWIQDRGIPPEFWVIALPVFMGLATLAFFRVALGVLLGVSVAAAVLSIGLVVADRDPVDRGTPAGGVVSVVAFSSAEDENTPVGDPERDAWDSARDAFLGTTVDHILETTPTATDPWGLADWWSERTRDIPRGTANLVLALATAAGFCSGLLCLLLPTSTLVFATSICGGWLLSSAMATGYARWMPGGSPPTVFVTMLGWIVLSGLGVIFQWKTPGRGRTD